MKKIFAAIMSLCIVGGSLPVVYSSTPECAITASAEDYPITGKNEDIKWSLDGEGTLTISGKGDMPDRALESINKSYGVKIKRLIISEGITSTSLGLYMPNLESLSLASTLKSIESISFMHSNLKTVTIPNSVTYLGVSAFNDCKNLTSVQLSKSLERISPSTFCDCVSLESITIPASVESIGSGAFYGCTSLETVIIEPRNTPLYVEADAFKGTLWLKNRPADIVISGILFDIDAYSFDGNLEIPEEISGLSIGTLERIDEAGLNSIIVRNPKCAFDNYELTKFKGTIYADEGSYAQKYAEKYGINFDTLDNAPKRSEQSSETTTSAVETEITTNESATSAEISTEATAPPQTETSASPTQDTSAAPTNETAGTTSGSKLKTGDANGDGDINMSDVVIVMQASLNPKKYGVNGTSEDRITAEGEKAGDVDGKDGLSANDALIIQRYSLKLIDTL